MVNSLISFVVVPIVVLADASCSFDSGNDSMCGWENTVKGVHVPQWELEEYTIATTRGSGNSSCISYTFSLYT